MLSELLNPVGSHLSQLLLPGWVIQRVWEPQAIQECFQPLVSLSTRIWISSKTRKIPLKCKNKLKSFWLSVRGNVNSKTSINLRRRDWESMRRKNKVAPIVGESSERSSRSRHPAVSTTILGTKGFHKLMNLTWGTRIRSWIFLTSRMLSKWRKISSRL